MRLVVVAAPLMTGAMMKRFTATTTLAAVPAAKASKLRQKVVKASELAAMLDVTEVQ